MSEVELPRVRVTSSRSSRSDNDNSITLQGLSPAESDGAHAFSRGAEWMAVEDGRLVFCPRFEPLPEPVEDPLIAPYWNPEIPVSSRPFQYDMFPFDTERIKATFPSIHISSLCGYYYSPENYREQAEKLTRWGFFCMRSRRGDDGGYWEVWYLSGLYAAKKELARALSGSGTSLSFLEREQQKLERAVDFLRSNAVFGSLSVSVQRLAMPIPD